MTMVPRTGPFSAISARAITSWYQRGKSSARDTIAPLVMGAQDIGVPTARPTGAAASKTGAAASKADGAAPHASVGLGGPAMNGLDPRRGVVRVDPGRLQQLL